jgi:sortase A
VSEQTSESIPPSNILSISEIGIYGKIYEGEGADTMNKGIWHRPHTSTPDVGGNTVLVAHRHLYTSGPDTFYHLPKLQKGSKITLYWQQKKYSYVVVDTRIVEPDESHIEKNTFEHQLTLYTCTPLWTSAKRFVVTAKPI